MTKTLEQIQQENRKFILEAIHGCSYEEALEKELGVGCKVIDKKHQFFGELSPTEMTLVYGNAVDGEESDLLYFLHFRGNPGVRFSKQDIFDKNKFEIIGKPLTLSRVLLALKSKEDLSNPKKTLFYEGITKLFYYNYPKNIELVLDLTKETLEEQTEETQREINELLTINN